MMEKQCIICKNISDQFYYSPTHGGFICEDCHDEIIKSPYPDDPDIIGDGTGFGFGNNV